MKKIALPYVPKWAKISLIVLGILLIAYVAVGWYFSSKLFEISPQKVAYDQTITAIEDASYTFIGSAYDIDGVVGGIREDGSMVGLFSAPTKLDEQTQTSTRELQARSGTELKRGEEISLQGNIWITDPKQALGVDYQDVTYKSPVGDMDAWFIPGQSKTSWTIGVHGIGAHKNELLRFIKPVLAAGNSMMIINYRGDVGNPASPDNRNHFGDTEWQDVEAAMRYAKEQGATEIQLYGVSLGGSLTQNYLRRSTDVKSMNITKVVLDSPALDWSEILSHRTEKMGFPGFLAKPGMDMARVRAGINFKRATTEPGSIQHNTLIIHNQDDTSVPQAASKRVAAAQPDKVTFVDFGSGGHIRAWNHDQARYEKLVTDFLKK